MWLVIWIISFLVSAAIDFKKVSVTCIYKGHNNGVLLKLIILIQHVNLHNACDNILWTSLMFFVDGISCFRISELFFIS